MDPILREINFGQNQYCGPSALSALTGRNTDDCADILSRVAGRRIIKGVETPYMRMALKELRYKCEQVNACTNSSLYWTVTVLFNQGNGAYLIVVPNHYITIEVKDRQAYICDNHTRVPLDLKHSARLMQTCKEVYKVIPVPDPVFIESRIEITNINNIIKVRVHRIYENPEDNTSYDAGSIMARSKYDLGMIKLKLDEVL